jgi:Co/Zn/Cd efflux system component
MSDCGCDIQIKDNEQKQVLYLLLVINATMFVAEMSLGWTAESTSLIADSLDMLADAIVYSIGLYAVGKAASDKAKVALLSGYFQAALGGLIILDIVRRIVLGSEPLPAFMMVVGLVALIANVVCLLLIQQHKDGEVHMRASWIFSANDVIANTGIIISGGLVWWLDSRWPDIIIGAVIALVIFRGAWLIVKDARSELNALYNDKTVCCSDKSY